MATKSKKIVSVVPEAFEAITETPAWNPPALSLTPPSLPVPSFIPASFKPPSFKPHSFKPMSLEALADISRANLEAMTKANRVLAEGLQALGKEILTYARSSLEHASQTATALLGAKTFDEVIQLNNDLAKSNLETMLARSAKLSEMGVTIASDALAPLGGRVEATLAKFTKAAA
jgi:phasin family protein